jgi:hypothetical protein
LLDRLAAWQRNFDRHCHWERGWNSREARDSWVGEGRDLADQVRAEPGDRAELEMGDWALDP